MTQPDAVRALLLAAVPARILLDLCGSIQLVGGSLPQLASAFLVAAFVASALARPAGLASHRLRAPLAAVGVLLLLGALRAVEPSALRFGLLYLGPLALIAAAPSWLRRTDGDLLLRAVCAVGAIPVAISLAAWVAGQPAEHVLHGYPRLHGAYDDVHPHALAMAMLVVSGSALLLGSGPRGWRAWGGLIAIGAAACLLATWVRTGMILASVGVALLLEAHARWRAVAACAVVGAVAWALSPELRDRFSDVVAILTGAAPAGGWGALGSWRVVIWSDSLATFADGGAAQIALGRGLGGHIGLHKDLDPHSELLALLFQLGVLGPVAVAWLWAASLRACFRVRRSDIGRLGLAWLGALAPAALVSNAFLGRLALSWFTALVVAAALSSEEE